MSCFQQLTVSLNATYLAWSGSRERSLCWTKSLHNLHTAVVVAVNTSVTFSLFNFKGLNLCCSDTSRCSTLDPTFRSSSSVWWFLVFQKLKCQWVKPDTEFYPVNLIITRERAVRTTDKWPFLCCVDAGGDKQDGNDQEDGKNGESEPLNEPNQQPNNDWAHLFVYYAATK